ncbi:MAG: hypothetical protein EA377_14425 [Phycisphaerales bacterium]|nr:MAG: hypothetical protein EA377_14425 [Phycisphaerales bacterium]
MANRYHARVTLRHDEPETLDQAAERIDRHWIDWGEPLLAAGAEWLLERGVSDGPLLRLDGWIVVLPGRRAGRLLLEQVVREAAARGRAIVPPELHTPGSIVDRLRPPDPDAAPRASRLEHLLAWSRTLADHPDELLPLMPSPPAADDELGRWALAELILTRAEELAGSELDFGLLARDPEIQGMGSEAARWSALATLEAHCAAELRRAGLADPLRDRRESCNDPDERTDEQKEILLIGIAELNALQRRTLNESPCRITALVHVPELLAEGFGVYGEVRPEFWSERSLSVRDEQIIVTERPGDQAQAALRTAIEAGAGEHPSAVRIGLTDDELAPHLERAAAWADQPIHLATGHDIRMTSPARLLAAVAQWLRDPRFATFATLLRHPAVEQWLKRRAGAKETEIEQATDDWLTLLDQSFSDHLHARLTSPWLGSDDRRVRMKQLHDQVHDLFSPLLDGGARPIGAWAEPILDVLERLYVDSEDVLINEALHLIREGLQKIAQLEPAIQPEVEAGLAVLFLLDCVQEPVVGPAQSHEVDVLGWLELHLDPAPVLIVMGVNDGALPQAQLGDLLLPDHVRERLGLACNRSRAARDAYLLEAMHQSRETLVLITGRTNADGDPLVPSRLLLACEDEALPKRILQQADPSRARRWPVPLHAPPAADHSAFTIPEPDDSSPEFEKLSISQLNAYLRCPYRFWLQHVLKLRVLEDHAYEMDAARFGTLLHDVLQRFGEDPGIRESRNANEISAYLSDQLETLAGNRFGEAPLPAVRIQLAQLLHRLEAFAQVQAVTAAEGWCIVHTELSLPESSVIDLPGEEPMRLSGKIDRIDRFGDTDRYRIIDYKTGDSAKSPVEVHHGSKKVNDEWQNLQLPLYDHLARQAKIVAGDVELGYFHITKTAAETNWDPAPWGEGQLESALECAREVIRNIRAGRFSNRMPIPPEYDDFARICQTAAFHDEENQDAEDDSSSSRYAGGDD